tara:strand:- start:98 stop:481 length:384 start_codon:yes stop_codon:yes gene_type:complete
MKNRTINNRRWFSGMLVKKPYEKKKKVQDRPDHLCVVPPPKLFQLEWFRDGWYDEVKKYATRKGEETRTQGYQEWLLWINVFEKMDWYWDPTGQQKIEYLSRYYPAKVQAREIMNAKKLNKKRRVLK